MRTWLLAVPAVLALGACGSTPFVGSTVAQTPVSQQEVVGEARRASKAHTDLGMVYLRQGQLNVAFDEARKAIDADSSYPLAYNLLGLVQMYLKENAAAEATFGEALRLAPNDPEINNNYGWFLCQTGRERQSIPYFVTAADVPLNVSPTKPLTNGGVCSVMVGDDKTAEDLLQKALRADPQNADAMFVLAELYYRNNRLTEAQTKLEQMQRFSEPAAPSVWLGLRIERKLGNRDAERRYATQLRRSFSESREYQLLMQGRYQ
ncbi:MAG TPA: type IV pilus biogenesis/stability protein PilW [Rhodocyclaceae bacterium]|nr:type IV pilus biogenesis/stability protein PilW [Rhodocyclaceae bacterium]